MSVILLDCADQNLICTESPQIYSGDINTDSIIVDFNETWNGFTKTAVFFRDRANAYHVLIGNDGSAVVPQEVMKDKGVFYIGIIGVHGDDVLTSSLIKYKVGEGAVSENLKVPAPTQDIYDQILAEYNHAIDVCVTTHEAKIAKCETVTDECYSAIASLQLEWNNYDGGYPASNMNDADDVDGGYPLVG